MEAREEAYPDRLPLPKRAPRFRWRRIRLGRRGRGILLALTFLTAVFAGSSFWENDGGRPFFSWESFRPDVLAEGLVYAICLIAILGSHEMGHYIACRRYGIPASPPVFIPGLPPLGTFGAVIRIRGAIPGRKALFDVAAAGPLAGFAVALPIYVAGIWTATPTIENPPSGGLFIGEPLLHVLLVAAIHGTASLKVGSLYGAGWVGMLVTSMNLFPVGQLDGGHVLYSISRRLHRTVAWATIVALAAFVLLQIWVLRMVPAYSLWLVIMLWLRDRHPRLIDESEPLGTGRTAIALVLAVIFVVAFIPVPFRLIP